MTRNQKIILAAILLIGAFLIFWRLDQHDMLGDDATYAFRSIGYFDYMASNGQTTPVQWFGDRPWWSFLSFHDHPPLYFLIHFLFFKILGASVLIARLPSALAAAGSLVLAFLIARRLAGVRAGLIATGALALNSYFLWTARIGLLESLTMFFMLLGVWFFVQAFEKDRNFLWSGLFFGCSFLCKYSVLFLVPGLVFFILWQKRILFRNRNFWLGLLIFFIVISPVLIFNAKVFMARGHFDVQLDRIFTQPHQDWNILDTGQDTVRFSPLEVMRLQIEGMSMPYFLIFVFALVWLVYSAIHKRIAKELLLPILLWLSFLLGFSLTGAAPRWVGIVSPFIALIIGIGFSLLPDNKKWMSLTTRGAVVIVSVFAIFYCLNTNQFVKPLGPKTVYADFRLENFGYNQLDKFLTEIFREIEPPKETQRLVHEWWYKNIQPEAIDFQPLILTARRREANPLIIYDSKIHWFPALWTFEKWKLFNGLLIMNTDQFMKGYENGATALIDAAKITDFYYIHAGEAILADQEKDKNRPDVKLDVGMLVREGIEPVIIYDDNNRAAFYIYHKIFK